MAKYDVHIVGAGPAGSMAAKSAAESGLRVLVSEQHAKIGEPVQCSGHISASGMREIEKMGVPYEKTVLNKIHGCTAYGKNNNFHVRSREPKALVIDRAELDVLFSQAAQDAGAEIKMCDNVKSVSDLHAQNVIGADGANSQIARLFNFDAIEMRNYVMCMQADCNYSLPVKDEVDVHLSQEIAPGFFGWAIPVNEEVTKIGLGVRAGLPVRDYFNRFIQQKYPEARGKEISKLAGLIPLKPRKKTAITNIHGKRNILLVGDAAGQVKASTGGGVLFGAVCGKFAGELIAKETAATEYERAWRARFQADLSLHYGARRLLNTLGDVRLDQLLNMARMLKADSFLEKYGDMDFPSRTLRQADMKSFNILTPIVQGMLNLASQGGI
ncbi:Digeranylgeranylglycerophospholipid reductase [Candidatus Gugararchaeum adminiculabundum]|nr:Digeranylgeranylglycerophospholipid reductase [Candidatus Gugararchaeum adminiculabundum]